MSPYRPPAAARALLRLLLPGAVHEEFAGDLEERFHRVAEVDVKSARRNYWRDVLSPTVIRFRREARGMPLPPGSSPTSGRGGGSMSGLVADLKFAFRTLSKAPAFTAVAVLSLALGIGPNTAIFSLVTSVLFQDWGVEDPEGVIDIYTLNRDGRYFFNRYGTYELLAAGTDDVFEAVTHHSMFSGRIEGVDGDNELVLGEMVAGNYFDVMGVRATHGRTFLPEEDATEGTHPVIVVSDDFWRSRYGRDPGLLGGEVRLNGRPYTVLGVMPPAFRGRIAPGIGTDFWVPFSMYTHLSPGKMGAGDLTISGRVLTGVSPEQAIAAAETVASRRDDELTDANPDRRGRFAVAAVSLADVKLHPNFDNTLTAMAALLFVAVGLVLLVACVNLAGFLLSRAMDRRKEMAVRIAMGAGRGAIVRQLLVESLLLAGVGAVVGLVLGQIAMKALLRVEPPIPIPLELEVGLNAPLLFFTAAASVFAAVLFGLTPALEATRVPVAGTLRDEAGASSGRGKVGLRGLLVATQMALSTVLLFGATLFVRSLGSASDVDLGFSTREAAIVKIESGANEYTGEQRVQFVDDLTRRLASETNIAAFGITGRMPVDLGMSITTFDVPGVDPPPDENRHRLESTAITPGYFEAMGVRLIEGRAFQLSDVFESQHVTILSRAASVRLWPSESAVGKVLYRGRDQEDPLVVVGVVDDVKIWSLSEAPKPYLYLPYHQGNAYGTFFVAARSSASPADLAAQIRDHAKAIDPQIFLTSVGTLRQHLGYIYFLPRMAAVMLSLIGVLALVLGCMGLYGMVSYGVSRRTREMGIRLALGAHREGVIRMVLMGGLRLVLVGGLFGLAASLLLGRLVERFLFGVDGMDPVSILIAPAVLASVAVLASYLPARRASRVDPVQALRTD